MNSSDKSAGLVAKWLMGLLLLFVQLHLCQAEYILPGGETCFTCPALDQKDHTGTQVEVTGGNHGDCHDCCELKPCDEAGKDKVAVVQSFQVEVVFAIPGAIPTLVIPTLEQPYIEFEFIEGCPTTGPPASGQSRAPPTSSSV